MAGEEEKNSDLYGVMGLKKECTPAELRNAYKKLAMKWHPDRCSASANQKYVEEAKKKFQDIQQAYSVLSDANKRFLYDVGVYNSDDDDDDENGMGEFLNEMASMMNQTKPANESKNESFEDLQQLFEEIFQSETADTHTLCSSSSSRSTAPPSYADSCSRESKKRKSYSYSYSSEEKGVVERGGGGGGGGVSRKQKVASGHAVSSSSSSSSCRGISA